MIVAGEVQYSVENEHFDFRRKRVPLLNRLTARGGNAYGEIAADFTCSRRGGIRREREDIGGLVFASEAAIEFALFRIGGEQDRYLAAEFRGATGLGKKAGECGGRRHAQITRWTP